MRLPFHLSDPGTRRYLFRCLRWVTRKELSFCPNCGCRLGATIDRKYLITSLVECDECRLLFRRPQEPADFAEHFYQEEYQSSLATVLPDRKSLTKMTDNGFKETEKDFSDKIALLDKLGLKRGSRLLDFGASWGYGVWQLKKAGYDAQGFELSRPRAEYGTRCLQVPIASDFSKLVSGRKFDAIFTNHVLEHIPKISKVIFDLSNLLEPDGVLVAFVPNGSRSCQTANWKRFHSNWGRLHPIYLNDRFLMKQFSQRPIFVTAKRYNTAMDVNKLCDWNRDSQVCDDLSENELCFIAYPNRRIMERLMP